MNEAEKGEGSFRRAPLLIAATGLVVLIAAGGLLLLRHPAPPRANAPAFPPAASPPGSPPAASAASSPSSASSAAPGFDVIRIGPDRMAVIAGRAPPGSEVRIRDNGQVLATTKTDASGTFVILPASPLAAGPHDFSLEATAPDGTVIRGERDALLVVNPKAEGAASSPVALAPNEAASGALPALLGSSSAPGERRVMVEVIDYDEAGQVRLSGTAPAGAVLIVSVDGEKLAETESDAAGHWAAALGKPIPPGPHRLEVFASSREGTVIAQLELPFLREAAAGHLTPGAIVVKQGDSLWRIARNLYGQGTRYTIIYAQNRDRIRNPDIIYPGQTLSLPPPAAGTTPAPSRSSR